MQENGKGKIPNLWTVEKHRNRNTLINRKRCFFSSRHETDLSKLKGLQRTDGLMFDSSWGLEIFSMSHARDKTKKHSSLFLYRAQNLLSLIFYLPQSLILHFITEQNQKLDGDTTKDYLAALCGGCAFQGLNALFGVSLVNRDWSYDTGYYMTITVKDTDGNFIANNSDASGIPVPDFNFTYVAK